MKRILHAHQSRLHGGAIVDDIQPISLPQFSVLDPLVSLSSMSPTLARPLTSIHSVRGVSERPHMRAHRIRNSESRVPRAFQHSSAAAGFLPRAEIPDDLPMGTLSRRRYASALSATERDQQFRPVSPPDGPGKARSYSAALRGRRRSRPGGNPQTRFQMIAVGTAQTL